MSRKHVRMWNEGCSCGKEKWFPHGWRRLVMIYGRPYKGPVQITTYTFDSNKEGQ